MGLAVAGLAIGLSAAVLPAEAHGTSYNTSRLSADGADLWAVVDGWGLIHSPDGGGRWEWVCEEAIGVLASYDVLAQQGGAVVATSSGLRWLEGGCAGAEIPGTPTAAPVTLLLGREGGFWAAATGTEQAGLWDCTVAGCAPTELVGAAPARRFVRSMVEDRAVAGRAWATVMREEDLGVELYRGEGGAWTRVAGWEGSDVRVMLADGDRVLAWEQPRSAERAPKVLRSDDGGQNFVEGFSTGTYQDQIPTLVEVDGRTFISSWLGRTWCAEDGGSNFREVSAEAPLLRCMAQGEGGEVWVCADHFADGYDVGRYMGGGEFAAVGCLDQVELAECHQQTCGELYFTFSTYGGSTAGVCGQQEDTGEAEGGGGCRGGCGGGDSGALIGLIGLQGAAMARRRRNR